MDTNQPFVMPQQATPQMPQQPLQPMPTSLPPKKRGNVFLVVLTITLVLAAGALGYLYYSTNESLRGKSQELSKAYQTIERLQEEQDSNPAQQEKEFIWRNNTAELSRGLCAGQPLLMSDVHLTDNFAVFRYLCANEAGGTPILLGALQKLNDGSYEFTYGSATTNANALPDYIYDEDPEFFGNWYGVNRM